jgi:hypothetical protein
MPEVNLRLDDLEALAVHHALSPAVTLIDQVEADSGVPKHAPLSGARPRLVKVAQRLDHERRYRGAVPNPNGPPGELAEQSAILRASAAIQNAVEAGVDRATLHAQVDLAKERT